MAQPSLAAIDQKSTHKNNIHYFDKTLANSKQMFNNRLVATTIMQLVLFGSMIWRHKLA
jgi:hypothetical protein